MPEGDGVALFAAVKTFHSEGKDMLSAVSQLMLASINSGESLDAIRQNFENDYQIKDVPTDAARTILKRLKKDGLVQYGDDKKIFLTDEGAGVQASLKQAISSLNRDLNDLIDNMLSYFDARKYARPNDPSRSLLNFIDENMALTTSTLSRKGSNQARVDSKIAEYILHIEKSDSQRFSLLQNMFFGRLYLSVMRVRSDFAKNTRLESLDVYLDTSVLLSCLGLHDTAATEQATELLKIVQGHQKMRVVVADETVNEARRLLGSAAQQGMRYVASVPVHSIYYQLNQKGYDQNRINLLLETLDERIGKLGVDIVTIAVDKNGKNYKAISGEIDTWASLLGHPKRPSTLDHDASLLNYIFDIRHGVHSKVFEKNRAIFVSPDSAIIQYSKEKADHDMRFPLAITPIELTSLLWIRDIGSDSIASSVMRQSIMAYVRERAIGHALWEKFVGELESALKLDAISEEDIGIILSSSDTFELLATDAKNASKTIINQDYISGLQAKRQETIVELDHQEARVAAALSRIDIISKFLALIVSVIIWIVVTVVCSCVFYLALSLTSLENVLNIGAVAIFACVFGGILIFGRELRFFDLLLRFRSTVHGSLKDFFESKIVHFFGLEK